MCASDLLFMTVNTSQNCFLGFQDLFLGGTGASFFAFGVILVKRHAIHLKSETLGAGEMVSLTKCLQQHKLECLNLALAPVW